MNTASDKINALSIDVEDYFQVQALSPVIGKDQWASCESRVERNVERILELLSETGATATFFTLGWIAERHPKMVQRIVAEGHELASHGYCHDRVDEQSPESFRSDIRKAKAILEDCGGAPVVGYRAATFSIGPETGWAFPILEEEGYRYSSSIYPVRHDNYAFPDAPRFAYRPERVQELWEFPIATVRLAGRNYPCGGGGFFRLYPYALSRSWLSRVNRRDGAPAVFYFHPWEIDPDQPRPAGVPFKSRLRHYLNLKGMEGRLRRLLHDFSWKRIDHVFAHRLASKSDSAAA